MSQPSLHAPTISKIPLEQRVSTRVRAVIDGVVEADAEPAQESKKILRVDAGSAVAAKAPVAPRKEGAPVRGLAMAIVESADQFGQTPILIPGPRVKLQVNFFVALASEIGAICKRDLRIEALSPAAAGWAGVMRLRPHRVAVRGLAEALPFGSNIFEMNRITRPQGIKRPLCLGLITSFGMHRWLPTDPQYRLIVLEATEHANLTVSTRAAVQRYRLAPIAG